MKIIKIPQKDQITVSEKVALITSFMSLIAVILQILIILFA